MAHLSAAAVKQIEEIIARYTNENTPLMMILSDVQRENAKLPIALICFGILIFDNDLQFLNALYPIFVILLPTDTFFNFLQL